MLNARKDRPTPTMGTRLTTLMSRETWKSASGEHSRLDVVQYEPAEMVELFTADERGALERGFQVIRHSKHGAETIYVDAVQAALKGGL